MTLLSIDWVASATFTLAVVTVVLAYFTCQAARASSRMVNEAQRDRELGIQPYIVFGAVAFPLDAGQSGTIYLSDDNRRAIGTLDEMRFLQRVEVCLQNVGRGPALTCQYAGRFAWTMREPAQDGTPVIAPRHFISDAFALNVAQKETHPAPWAEADSPPAALADLVIKDSPEDVNVVTCRDQFEHKYRFVLGRQSPEVFYADRRATKWWRPGEPEPEWTRGW